MATRENWAPTVEAVGALLRARTKDRAGNEIGTFNEFTRPTGVQVQELIVAAQDAVIARLGTEDIVPRWQSQAMAVAALGTAMRVELGYYPEQVNTGRSPYPQIKELYDTEMAVLVKAVEHGEDGIDTPGGESGGDIAPVWTGLPNAEPPGPLVWNPINQSWDRHTAAIQSWDRW